MAQNWQNVGANSRSRVTSARRRGGASATAPTGRTYRARRSTSTRWQRTSAAPWGWRHERPGRGIGGDRRLNRRARRVLAKLGDKPTVSIPAACGGWRETRAADRLFDHAAVTAEAVLAPHIACTVERMGAHPRVLCIEDTGEIDYPGKPSMQGLRPLNRETRQGLYLHPTLAVPRAALPGAARCPPLDPCRAGHTPGPPLPRPHPPRCGDRRPPGQRAPSARWRGACRLAVADQPARGHPRAGPGEAAMVPLPVANRGLLQNPQERLPPTRSCNWRGSNAWSRRSPST
jgi:hypothetical protein